MRNHKSILKCLFAVLVLLQTSACMKMERLGGAAAFNGANGNGTGSADDVSSVVPTASQWLGMNIDSDLVYNDITRMLNAFDSTQKDANGYPAPGVSGSSSSDVGFLLPTGDYKVSYEGTGGVAFSGIASLVGSWQTVGNEHRAVVHITGAKGSYGQMLGVQINNASGQYVHALHIFMPGTDYGTKEVFWPTYLSLLKPFRSMRFMNFMDGGGSKTYWSDVPRMWSTAGATEPTFGNNSGGQPYEVLYLLANATGNDIWLNIPANTTDDAMLDVAHMSAADRANSYLLQLADMLRDHLDFKGIAEKRRQRGIKDPFQINIEIGNEHWAGNSVGYNHFVAMAKANPSRYTMAYHPNPLPYPSSGWQGGNSNPDWQLEAEYAADRAALVGKFFKSEFAAVHQESVIHPVLGGWAIGATLSDIGLNFLQLQYGSAKSVVDYVAIAPYFGSTSASDYQSVMNGLIPAIQQMQSTWNDFKDLQNRYGVQIVAYEGGQGLSTPTPDYDWNSFHSSPGEIANVRMMERAQFDKRMYDAYRVYFQMWLDTFGAKALFHHYTLSGFAGPDPFGMTWGYWGSLPFATIDVSTCGQGLKNLQGDEEVSTLFGYCPKYQGLLDAAFFVPNK